MKRIIWVVVLILTLGTFLGTGTAVLAGPTRETPTPEELIAGMAQPSSDPMFTIVPKKPSLEAGLSWCIDDPLYSLNYELNDHTYAGFNLQIPPPDQGYDSITNVYGSYLFSFGLFVAGDYYAWGSESELTLSPGYRYNLQDKGYLAASCNLKSQNNSGSEFAGYKVEGQYYDETKLISGRISLPKDEVNTFEVESNFTATPEIIWGVNCNGGDYFNYSAGLTWTKEAWVVDAAVGSDTDKFFCSLNGLYKINDQFNLGLENKFGNGNPQYTLKAGCLNKLFTANLMYKIDPAMFYLTYKLNI
jgi:hypothetical protein